VASFPVDTPLTTLQTPVLASHSLNLTPNQAMPSLSLTPQLGTASTSQVIDGSLLGFTGATNASMPGSGHLRDCSQSLASSGQTTFQSFLPQRQGQASVLRAVGGTPTRTLAPVGGSRSAATTAAVSARPQSSPAVQLGKLQQFSQFLEGCASQVRADLSSRHDRQLCSESLAEH
jgi:hypothetical protein